MPHYPESVRKLQPTLHILEIMDADIAQTLQKMTQAGFLQKGAGCHDVTDLGDRAGGAHAFGPGGIIQQSGYARCRRQAQDEPQRGCSVGHHHTHDLALACERQQQPSQCERHAQQRAIRLLLQAHVLEELIAGTEGLLRIQECLEQRPLRTRGHQHVEQNAAHQLTGAPPSLLGGGQLWHGYMPARLDGDADLRKEFQWVNARQTAEVAASGPLDAHGDDRRPRFRRHEGGAVVHLHQRAGDGQAPLGKDDHGLAGLHQAADEFDRQRTGGVHCQMRHVAQQPAEIPLRKHLGMDHEHRVHGQEHSQQRTVQKRLVVRDDEGSFIREYRRIAAEADSEQGAQQGAKDEPDQSGGGA
jgi:hypothetical protein